MTFFKSPLEKYAKSYPLIQNKLYHTAWITWKTLSLAFTVALCPRVVLAVVTEAVCCTLLGVSSCSTLEGIPVAYTYFYTP